MKGKHQFREEDELEKYTFDQKVQDDLRRSQERAQRPKEEPTVRVPDILSPGSSPEEQKQSRESATVRHQERQMPLERTPERQGLTERAGHGYQQEVEKAEQLLKQQIETARTLSEKLSG